MTATVTATTTATKDKLIAGISANIFFLGVVSFFTDVSTELIVAALPTYLVVKLGATPAIVGAIEGAAESITSFLRLPAGYIADRTGKRKGLTVIGYGLSNVVKPFIGFSVDWFQVLGFRMADRVGKGLRTPPRDTIIADSVRDGKVGRAFGVHRSLDQTGAIVGPVLAFLLLAPLGYEGMFLFTAIPGALAIAILLIYVKEPPTKGLANKVSLRNARSIMDKNFSIYAGSATLYAAAAISYAFILLRGVEIGVPVLFSPLIYAVIQVFHVVSGVPAGEVSDRLGRVRAVQIGYLALLVSFVVIAFSPNVWAFLVGAALFGVHQGMVETAQRAIIPSLVAEEYRGTAYGVYNTAVGIVIFPTNLVAGWLYSAGSGYAFLYGAGLAVMASLAALQRRTGRDSKQTLT